MNGNIIVAPPFPHGEIVNAFLMRAQRYAGASSLEKVCQQLLRRKPGLDGMPSYLGNFYTEIGYLYGDLDELIDKHTEFNFFACGLPKTRIAAQRARLIQAQPGPVRLCRLPLLFTGGENRYLQCPECDREQIKEFGFTFIHRRHGAPFVNVCPIHGIELHPGTTGGNLYDARCQASPNPYQKCMTAELGRRIEHCMENPADHSNYHKDRVVQLFKASGWVGDHGRFCESKFLTAFARYFAGAFSDMRLEVLCQSQQHIRCAARSLLRSDRALHPEWCVLFSWFAEQNPHPSQLARSEPEYSDRDATKRVVRSLLPGKAEIEFELLKCRTIRAAAAALGIATTTLTTLCDRFDIPFKRRPKKLCDQLMERIKAALQSGKNLTDAAADCGISVSTVWRQRVSLKIGVASREDIQAGVIQQAKEQWLGIISDNPGISTTALRKVNGSLYMRLYRGDKEWLENNKPPTQPRTDRAKPSLPPRLICCLNEALATAAQSCVAPQGKRVNVSKYRLQKLSCVTPYAARKCEEEKFVNKYGEDRRNFYIARIARHVGRPINRPDSKGATPEERFEKAPSSFAKKVGLRETSIRNVMKSKEQK